MYSKIKVKGLQTLWDLLTQRAITEPFWRLKSSGKRCLEINKPIQKLILKKDKSNEQ